MPGVLTSWIDHLQIVHLDLPLLAARDLPDCPQVLSLQGCLQVLSPKGCLQVLSPKGCLPVLSLRHLQV